MGNPDMTSTNVAWGTELLPGIITNAPSAIEFQDRYSLNTEKLKKIRFQASSHSCVYRPSNYFTLILSNNSSGRLCGTSDGEKFTTDVRDGLLTFVPQNIRQTFDFQGCTTNTGLMLDESVFSYVRDTNSELAHVRLDEPRIGFYQPHLTNLIAVHNQIASVQDMGWRAMSEAHTLMIAAATLGVFSKHDEKTATNLSDQELRMVLDYANANVEENVGLIEAASVLNRDAFNFARAFKGKTGSSFANWMINNRLNQAKEMLRTTRMSIAEVAYACGFSSQSHLTSTMRKRTGDTPGSVRKRD